VSAAHYYEERSSGRFAVYGSNSKLICYAVSKEWAEWIIGKLSNESWSDLPKGYKE